MPVNITKSYKVSSLDPTIFTNINSALINVEISSLTNQTFSANPSNSNELEPIYPIDTVEDGVFGDNGASLAVALSD